jgi:hypothetical protein
MLGFFQDAERRGKSILILLNEPGDVNWIFDKTEHYKYATSRCKNAVIGPMIFMPEPTTDPLKHWLYQSGHTNYVAPSTWVKNFIENQLSPPPPKQIHVWGAGVDTDFFHPSKTSNKTQDYFIYFKSQNWETLRRLHAYFFNSYFKISGSILCYYNYTPEMLRSASQASRFCIYVNNQETQGLASLEIMACECPLFVVDEPEKNPSVTCWDDTVCGVKSTIDSIEKDFPVFLQELESFKPRSFVCNNYSFESAARNLLGLLESAQLK